MIWVFGKSRGPFSFPVLIKNGEEIGSFLCRELPVLSYGKRAQRDVKDTDPFQFYDSVPEMLAHTADLSV